MALINELSQEMVLYFNMFCAVVELRVAGDHDRGLVVDVQGCGVSEVKAEFGE